jgi:hypothetical protein
MHVAIGMTVDKHQPSYHAFWEKNIAYSKPAGRIT